MRVGERASWNCQLQRFGSIARATSSARLRNLFRFDKSQTELRTVLAARSADRIGRGVRVVRAFVQDAW
jgi:hypothetical protein